MGALSSVSACPVEGSGSVADLHSAWILEGWERREGDPPFVFAEKLARFYDFDGNGIVIHDSWDPQKRVARSARQYGSFFEATFDSFKSARHAVTDGPHVIYGRDLAASSLEFIARLEAKDGQVNAARAQSQTVWRCTDKGWRIAREQNAVDDLEVAAADAILQSNPSPTPTVVVEPGARSEEGRATALLRKAFDNWAAGGNSFFSDALRDDTVWTIEGSGRYAKTYTSRDAFMNEAIVPFAQRMKQPVRPTVRQILSEGNHIVVVWDGRGVAKDGQPYSNSYVWLFEMDGDKASRVTAFLDLQPYAAVLERIK
jgi:ketosteroid isomerase-like protein